MKNNELMRWGIFVTFCGALLLLFRDGSSLRLEAARHQLRRQRTQNRELNEEVISLKSRIYAISRNDEYLERVARSNLLLGRKKEKVFLFDGE